MNTPVSFEIAKLLKEKGFDERLNYYYDSFGDIGSSKVKVNWNESEELLCSAPTIAEVVMWLYEKHGIWIRVTPKPYSHFLTHWRWEHMSTDYSTRNCGWERTEDYLLPTEAYEAAIIYILKNLI